MYVDALRNGGCVKSIYVFQSTWIIYLSRSRARFLTNLKWIQLECTKRTKHNFNWPWSEILKGKTLEHLLTHRNIRMWRKNWKIKKTILIMIVKRKKKMIRIEHALHNLNLFYCHKCLQLVSSSLQIKQKWYFLLFRHYFYWNFN